MLMKLSPSLPDSNVQEYVTSKRLTLVNRFVVKSLKDSLVIGLTSVGPPDVVGALLVVPRLHNTSHATTTWIK